jgi:predicted amidohydrolase
MKIALATPPLPTSIADCLQWTEQLVAKAAAEGGEIICFPESYIPGYPLNGMDMSERTQDKLQAALDGVCRMAAAHNIAVIMPMDWHSDAGFQNVAFVIDNTGKVLGYQTKNQLDPSEDRIWIPGTKRDIFEVNGVKFGIVICHEGFRYPEVTRWAARKGAAIVFHPNCTGSNEAGNKPTEWGCKDSPYYEKATMMRALENTIYFASVNHSFAYPDSASAVVAPDGRCIAHQPYGEAGVVVADIDVAEATGLLAKRLKAELY